MTTVVGHAGAVGTGPWTGFTPDNLHFSDTLAASAFLDSLAEYAQSASSFGFAIPADATITSLTVRGEYYFRGEAGVETSSERFLTLVPSYGGVYYGAQAHVDLAANEDASEWTTVEGVAHDNLPTVAQLNSPDFTVVASAHQHASWNTWVCLNYIQLIVEYDEYVPPEPPEPGATPPTVVTGGAYDITATTASPSGSVPADGGAAITHYGFACSTAPNPRRGTAGADGDVDLGSWWSFPITGLTPGTRYYLAAYAGNAAGDGWGADVTFVTLPVVPTVTTANAYDITATTATGGGMVWDEGGEGVDYYGLACSTLPNPRVGTAGADGRMYAVGVQWTFPLVGLTPGTRYYLAAYAGNAAGDGWGPDTTFVTHGIPTVATAGVYDITATSATGGGDVISDGGEAVTSRGVCWSVAENPTTAGSHTTDGSGSGVFVSHLTGLTNGVTYNVRAYAVNAVGIAYGAAVSFTATADAPPVEPPLGPPRDPSQNLLFDGTLELMVGTLYVAGSATQVRYSNSNPGGFGNLSFRLPADAPWGAFDAQVVKDAAVTMKHGLVGFAATLFEGEVTNDVSHATISGGKAYYDVTCAGLWWAAGQRKDFSMVIGDDDYGQWFAIDDNASAFKVSTSGLLDIRLEAGQSAAAGDGASLYYWLGKGMGDPAASIDFLIGLLSHNTLGANWHAEVSSALTPWGPWTEAAAWSNGSVTAYPSCFPITGTTPQALRFKLYTSSAVDTLDYDRYISLERVSVGSGVSANSLSAVSAANPTVVTATGAHGLKTGDRVFITQTAASTPTISGWRMVTVTDGAHFTVPVAVTTAGGAGTFYKATRIDQALVEIAVTTGLASLASLQPGGIGNLNWGLNVRPHASRAGAIDLLAATNVAPFDYGFWDNRTFRCQDRPATIRALHDYLIDSSLPGIDFDVRRATEDSPTTVKVLYKFRAEDGETGSYPDGTALAVYRSATTHTATYTANIIPTMTSATTPSGVASASSNLDASYAGWKAFDHVNDVYGWVPTAGTTGWLMYQFPAAHVITQYAVTSRNQGGGSARAPKSWTFKGSLNGTTWVTLDTRTNITDWATTANVRKVFPFANTTAYLYYRLDITASNDATYVGVGELEMMKTADWVPEWSDASPVLDVWNEWADLSLTTAQAGDLGDQILAWLSANAYQGGGTIAPATVPLRPTGHTANIIPAMTSATAPSGVASESGYDSPFAAWMAFDHTNPTAGAGAWVCTDGVTVGWLQYQFPTAHTVTRYAVTSRNRAAPNVQAPKTWTFKGSNNGSTWVTLDTRTNITDWATSPNVRKVFDFANTTAYAYYRLDITASNSATYVGVGELEMMGGVETAGRSAPTAYIRAGDYIEDSNLDTGPLMITGFSMDADRGIGSIAIGENRRAFVERLTPDQA